MDVIIAALLTVIAGLLFYRLVERRHKILLGKVALGLLGLTVVGIGVLAWIDERRGAAEQRPLTSVTVTFLEPSDSTRRERALDYALAGATGDLTFDRVSFEICNRGEELVEAVRFTASTFRPNRSTAYSLDADPQAGDTFESDFILPAGKCEVLTWRGRYRVYGPVVARPVRVSTTRYRPDNPYAPR